MPFLMIVLGENMSVTMKGVTVGGQKSPTAVQVKEFVTITSNTFISLGIWPFTMCGLSELTQAVQGVITTDL